MLSARKIESGKGIYDYSLSLLGGFDNIVELMRLNPFISNIDDGGAYLLNEDGTKILQENGYAIMAGVSGMDRFIGRELIYDDSVSQFVPPQINITTPTVTATTKTMQGFVGQNLFDIAMMGYGGFDQMVKMVIDSGIGSINEHDAAGIQFTLDSTIATDYAMKKVIEKQGLFFSTYSQLSFLLSEDGSFILQESGKKIAINE